MNGFTAHRSDNPLDWLNETSAVLEFLTKVSTCRAPADGSSSYEWRLSDSALFGQFLILEQCRLTIRNAVDALSERQQANPVKLAA